MNVLLCVLVSRCFLLIFADYGSQDCYDIPRSFPSDRNCSFEFNESLSNYFVRIKNCDFVINGYLYEQ